MRILLAVAVIPAVFLLRKVYLYDRLEKEPTGLLIKLLIFGAISTIPAGLLEQAGFGIVGALTRSKLQYTFWECFFVVAVAEECCKYLLLRLGSWKSKEFNCRYDGMVYAVYVSLGFALLENVQYVFSYGLGTGLARAITAIPGHACFGVFMGAFYGMTRMYANLGDRKAAARSRFFSLFFPILLHGAYDFFASLNGTLWSILFLAELAFIYFSGIRLVKSCSANDVYIA